MKKGKQFIGGLVAGAVIMAGGMGMGYAANNGTFSDVSPNASYYEAVKELSGQGIINGYDDGTFKPDKAITRGEAAILMYRLKDAIHGGQ